MYTRSWDNTRPNGATTNASTIDSEIQYTRVDLEERISALFGMSAIDFAADPVVPRKIALTHGTITDDAQTISATVTWNDAADTFTAIKLNVTNTASQAASKLIDLQVDGVSQFSAVRGGVGQSASVIVANQDNTNTASHAILRATVGGSSGGDPKVLFDLGAATVWVFGIDNSDSDIFKWSNNSTGALETTTLMSLTTSGALAVVAGITATTGTFTHGTITTDLKTIDASVTWNAAGVTFTAIKLNVTNTASAAASKLMDLQVGGSSIFVVNRAGWLSIGTNPAQNGAVRIPNGAGNHIMGRNAANSADFSLIHINSSDNVVVGNDNDLVLSHSGSTGTFDFHIRVVSDNTFDIGVDGASFRDIYADRDVYTNNAAALIRANTTMNNGAAAQVGTLTNAPSAGNPSKWIPIDDNGTTRYIPAWT